MKLHNLAKEVLQSAKDNYFDTIVHNCDGDLLGFVYMAGFYNDYLSNLYDNYDMLDSIWSIVRNDMRSIDGVYDSAQSEANNAGFKFNPLIDIEIFMQYIMGVYINDYAFSCGFLNDDNMYDAATPERIQEFIAMF